MRNVFGQKGYVEQKVDIDEETLTKIAQMTGGKYYRASNTTLFRKIYDEIDQLEKTEVEVKKYQRYRELYPWFILAGTVLLLFAINFTLQLIVLQQPQLQQPQLQQQRRLGFRSSTERYGRRCHQQDSVCPADPVPLRNRQH